MVMSDSACTHLCLIINSSAHLSELIFTPIGELILSINDTSSIISLVKRIDICHIIDVNAKTFHKLRTIHIYFIISLNIQIHENIFAACMRDISVSDRLITVLKCNILSQ